MHIEYKYNCISVKSYLQIDHKIIQTHILKNSYKDFTRKHNHKLFSYFIARFWNHLKILAHPSFDNPQG